MRLFNKKHNDDIFSAYHPELNFERLQHQSSNSRANTLTHVMHLFEEKNKYGPTPVSGPLPIKANGAIVVNRPSNHSHTGTIRSLPLYLQDKPDDYEEIQQPEADIGEMRMIDDNDESSSSNNTPSTIEEEEVDVIDMVHEENKRLRQQILLEREQYEKWRLAQEKLKEELTFAHNTIKNLQRMTDRFQKLLLPQTVIDRSSSSSGSKRSRHQSTGVTFDYNNNTQQQQIVASYERKLQILLNEIDAMELQEKESFKHLTIQKNEYEKLTRKLKYKDDIIRQLAYDLQFEKNYNNQRQL